MSTSLEDLCAFVMISRPILLRMRNVPDKCIKNQNTHFMFDNFFFLNRAVYKMSKNMLEPDRPQMSL